MPQFDGNVVLKPDTCHRLMARQSDDFAPHRLEWSTFDDLASGKCDALSVRALRRAERSRRLLLMRALMDDAAKNPGLVGPLPPLDEAWELLARVQSVSPRTLDRMLAHPYTGAWVGYVTRLLNNQVAGVGPLWTHVGYLHALAAAAAVHARIDFRLRIPVWDGAAILPTIGLARLSSAGHWTVTPVRANGDRVEIGEGADVVRLPPAFADDAPEWWGLRRISSVHNGFRLTVRLDDLDPYRGLHEPVPPDRLSHEEVEAWRELLAGAWRHIVACLPDLAQAFPSGLDSLVPRPAIPFSSLSASSGEAFGSAMVARPADPVALAATLVHEFHHFLLAGIQHLIPLHREDTRERFYTLWRDDPRPIAGTIHGIFAFFGVTNFWRAFALSGPVPERRRAQFEYAYWRTGVWRALRTVSGDDGLTPAGQRYLDNIAERLGPWQDERLPDDLVRLAGSAARDHHAGWRIRHVRPDPADVAGFADAWPGHGSRPARRTIDPVPTPVPDGSWSGARTQLLRVALRDSERLHDVWPMVPGATDADAAYAIGRHHSAVQGYLTDLGLDADPPDSWIGLGMALSAVNANSAAARALLDRPELVRAVYRAMNSTVRPNPGELADWIGRHLP